MKKLIFFTDLDGTLLDHQTYHWSAAQPALERLKSLDFPLIFNTSKTFAELRPLAYELNNIHPMICENGNVVAVPHHYFQQDQSHYLDYQTTLFGTDYQSITTTLQKLRIDYGFQFCGFNDLGVDGVMEKTGLSRQQAELACQRLCSEPLLWLGDEASLSAMRLELQKHRLSLTKGGRFYHVMSPMNKGRTMGWLLAKYQQLQPQTRWITVALGDSYNDLQMLEAAEYPVLIRNPHATSPDVSHIANLTSPLPPGPAGWNEAVNKIIDKHIED